MWRGLSAPIGSWKTICMCRRSAVNWRGAIAARSCPWKRIVPGGRPLEEEHGPPGRGLAAAALADEPESLAGLEGEADPVDGVHCLVAADDGPGPPDVVVDDKVRQPGAAAGRMPSRHVRLGGVRVPAGDGVARPNLSYGRRLSTAMVAGPLATWSKRAPIDELRHRGGRPGMAWNVLVRLAANLGTQRSNPTVYGWAGWSNRSRTLALSITRPAYITTTRSQWPATMPRLWVIRMAPRFERKTSSSNSSRIWAWIVTSRAVVGSSAIRSLWLACHSQGDYDPLALPAAQAVRVLEHPRSRVGDPHRGEQLDRASTGLVLVEPEVERQDLLEVRPRRSARG